MYYEIETKILYSLDDYTMQTTILYTKNTILYNANIYTVQCRPTFIEAQTTVLKTADKGYLTVQCSAVQCRSVHLCKREVMMTNQPGMPGQ